MNLEQQVASARKRVHRDGYDMSFGELASMYERDELVINPEYQRLFRWHPEKKTAFIESLLLGIPIPPIFIFTRSDGVWELIDGLQRVSTAKFSYAWRKAQGHCCLFKTEGATARRFMTETTT